MKNYVAGIFAGLCWLLPEQFLAAELELSDAFTLSLPSPGSHQVRIISPTVLELTRINSKRPDPARVDSWDFIDSAVQFRAPGGSDVSVLVDGQAVTVQSMGFKRRPLSAPLRKRDLRIANYLYLQLATPITEGQAVEVQNPSANLWPAEWQFKARLDPFRFSPAVHVNQVGYLPTLPKTAIVGYYLGNLGELDLPSATPFKLIDAKTGTVVHEGVLASHTDTGYTYSPKPYQKVWQADFSSFTQPGEYRLMVQGLGASWPFRIEEGVAMAFARTYALGMYHQRCGTANEMPFTRFTHGPCHTAPAEVPDRTFTVAQQFVAQASADYSILPRHTAPRLKDFDSSLYAFVNQGRVDVSGGHHDAGDYSKYTINSASLIHTLVFAADAFPGVAELDNLGIPESGDGISDLLQEAKWEADFLAKLQDADGGFFYLVYPRNRAYEFDVLPDQGDSQIVWPKTTSATAAAVAALAQCASSPAFRKSFPDAARTYLEKARKGWEFLSNAIAQYGEDGAYQKLISYGNEFMHDDELAWAACELFLATGEASYHDLLRRWFDPDDPNTWRWTWWRLFESYGNAIRSYAFGSRTGRLPASEFDSAFLGKCERQIRAAGNDLLARSRQNAYGTSFPLETKRIQTAGWYFSTDQAFDIAVASLLQPGDEMVRGYLYNLNYEAGCNPVNVSYVTGLGLKRQREMVHQYALNDRRALPPSGLPLGNIQDQMPYLDLYGGDLGKLTFPSDGGAAGPYPFYDRWADTFNVTTEFTVVNQARSLAGVALLAAQTSLKTQPWKPTAARITGLAPEIGVNTPVTASVETAGLDQQPATVVWEARDQEPGLGAGFTFVPVSQGAHWVEVEAQWPDGRRLFGATEFTATNGLPTVTVVSNDTAASETNSDPGSFTFSRTGNLDSDLTVKYSLAGNATKWDDYRTRQGNVPDSVTIPAGEKSATLTLYAVDDQIYEGAETARIVLLSDAAYNVGTPRQAEFSIEDNDPRVELPSILANPQGQIVIAGGDVTLRVIAAGTAPLSYQWRFNGQDIPGATSPELRLTSVQASQTGQYYAVVRNAGGSTESGSATLTVSVPVSLPTIPPPNPPPSSPANTVPSITGLSNRDTTVGVASVIVTFSMTDNETSADNLNLRVTSSNPTLVPDSNISVSGSGSNRTLAITPLADQAGSTSVTVSVSDGIATSSQSFLLTVTPTTHPLGTPPPSSPPPSPPPIQLPPAQPPPEPPPTQSPTIQPPPSQPPIIQVPPPSQPPPANSAPTIAVIPDQATDENTPTLPIEISVADKETGANDLILSAGSSNTRLVPIENILFSTGGSARHLVLIPAAKESGTAEITVTVSDGRQSASTRFGLTVRRGNPETVSTNIVRQNRAPTISFIADRKIWKNRSTSLIEFKIADAETPPDFLVVFAASDNAVLAPDFGFALGGSGADRNVVIQPAANQTGEARITLSVADPEGQVASASFRLTVEPGPAVKGDFDGDGIPDIIFEDADGFLAAWLMNRQNMKSVEFLIPSNVGDRDYHIVGSGDFNGDGHKDVLFQHKNGALALWYMEGLAQTGAAFLDPRIPVDAKWRVASICDLNRDGQVDLVLQDANGSLAVSYLNGTTQLSSEPLEPNATSDRDWRVVGSGDFNADGNEDLVLQFSDGALVVWFLEGKKLIGVSPTTPAGTGDAEWRLIGLADWNSDGNTDFLFQHRTNGTLAVWYMNGTKLTQSEFLTPDQPGGTWRIATP